jgi:hypothetical protein
MLSIEQNGTKHKIWLHRMESAMWCHCDNRFLYLLINTKVNDECNTSKDHNWNTCIFHWKTAFNCCFHWRIKFFDGYRSLTHWDVVNYFYSCEISPSGHKHVDKRRFLNLFNLPDNSNSFTTKFSTHTQLSHYTGIAPDSATGFDSW